MKPNTDTKYQDIIQCVLKHYPQTQAIYLFGSYGTPYERAASDVELAVLLPPLQAKQVRLVALNALYSELVVLLNRDVDLINLRQVSTVLQKEVIIAERRIYVAERYAADEFEMLTFSYYQNLNAERMAIVADALATGRLIV